MPSSSFSSPWKKHFDSPLFFELIKKWDHLPAAWKSKQDDTYDTKTISTLKRKCKGFCHLSNRPLEGTFWPSLAATGLTFSDSLPPHSCLVCWFNCYCVLLCFGWRKASLRAAAADICDTKYLRNWIKQKTERHSSWTNNPLVRTNSSVCSSGLDPTGTNRGGPRREPEWKGSGENARSQSETHVTPH